ncbi:hypothetical protein EVAR_7891_1 [Eumeta japonica]|uniref:Uncharacterized protein n=1 Tax=Eumeta variegata TaxID=151549 RepID=A0A4C1TVH1_EUMVA|nr:hypothetical protein EVAR_7891_1 [Eumeta japonica]
MSTDRARPASLTLPRSPTRGLACLPRSTSDGRLTRSDGILARREVLLRKKKNLVACKVGIRAKVLRDNDFECAARGRPIIVEWERDARHSAGLSRSVTHRYVTERYTFQSDSQPQPNLRRCHVKTTKRVWK